LTDTMLKVHLCGPLHPHGSLYLHEALSLLYGPLHVFRAFHYYGAPPLWVHSPPGREVRG